MDLCKKPNGAQAEQVKLSLRRVLSYRALPFEKMKRCGELANMSTRRLMILNSEIPLETHGDINEFPQETFQFIWHSKMCFVNSRV